MSYRSRLYNHRNAQAPENTNKTAFFSKQHESNDSKKPPFFQAKNIANSPGDKYEQEADNVANAVMANKSPKRFSKQKRINSIQRLATSLEDEKLGTNDQRMERDKEDKVKSVQRVAMPEKEKEKGVQKMDAPKKEEDKMKSVQRAAMPEKEKEKGVQKMDAPKKEEDKMKSVQRAAMPEKEKEKEIQKMDAPKKEEDKMKSVQRAAMPEKEKDKGVQKMDAPKKDDDKMKSVQRAPLPEKEKENGVQKMDSPEKEKEKKPAAASIQTKTDPGGTVASPQVSSRIESSAGKGNALPPKTIREMNSSFGTDFRNVHIHNDNEAASLNEELSAHAFTHGNDVYFNKGKYNPENPEGKHLLAHELTHVVQQTGKRDMVSKSDIADTPDANGCRMVTETPCPGSADNYTRLGYKGVMNLKNIGDCQLFIHSIDSAGNIIQRSSFSIQPGETKVYYSSDNAVDTAVVGSSYDTGTGRLEHPYNCV